MADSSLSNDALEVPAGIRSQLDAFRYAARRIALGRSLRLVAAVVMTATTAMFLLDRCLDTGSTLRAAIWLASMLAIGSAMLSYARLHAKTRSPLSSARWIRVQGIAIGDAVLGALELADHGEVNESAALRAAALKQVDATLKTGDFEPALPTSMNRWPVAWLISSVSLFLVIFAISPQVSANAFARWIVPWQAIPRITLTQLSETPEQLAVPLGEEWTFGVNASARSRWNPWAGTLTVGEFQRSSLDPTQNAEWTTPQTGYTFELPRLFEPQIALLRIGDTFHAFDVNPKPRPKIRRLEAIIELPDYLASHGITQPITRITGNTLRVLRGSIIRIKLEASTELRSAALNDVPMDVSDVEGVSKTLSCIADQACQIEITDGDGIDSLSPMKLTVETTRDRPPTIALRTGNIDEMVLSEETLAFDINVGDDFAIRRMGISWSETDSSGEALKTLEQPIPLSPEELSADRRKGSVQTKVRPSAYAMGAGRRQVRFWVEDHRPESERVYSRTVTLNVVAATEHAVWIDEQFSRWKQVVVEVHDRELSLFETNRQLAETPVGARKGNWQQQVLQQSRAERENARRLRQVTEEGRRLLAQAARNPEIDAEQIRQTAMALVDLEKLADDSMPRTAEWFENAAKSMTEDESDSAFDELIDVETSLAGSEPSESNSSTSEESTEPSDTTGSNEPRLSLAGTTIIDSSVSNDERQSKPNTKEQPDEIQLAVEDHAKVVESFDRVADQLSALMKGLQESTLVKRLKSASRRQDRIAAAIDETIEATFGETPST
ncbi:MAG: hypothetical protein AAGJ83_06520, partial [Planctomycetota bacterium]